MKILRRVNLSAALITVICFFLPWVQVSCSGAKDSLSGFDLARNGHTLLWLVPVLLIGLTLLEVSRGLRESRTLYSIVSVICGIVAALLMNSERVRVGDESALISAQMTGWFWLGLFATLAVVISGLLILFGIGRFAPKTESGKGSA